MTADGDTLDTGQIRRGDGRMHNSRDCAHGVAYMNLICTDEHNVGKWAFLVGDKLPTPTYALASGGECRSAAAAGAIDGFVPAKVGGESCADGSGE